MGFIEQFEGVKKYVKILLEKYPEMRNNDELLFFTVEDWKGMAIKSTHFKYGEGFFVPLKYIKTRRIVPFSSIVRARRKIQEENPELRPPNYEQKHESAERMRQHIVDEKTKSLDMF